MQQHEVAAAVEEPLTAAAAAPPPPRSMEDLLQPLERTVAWLASATEQELRDEAVLADQIGRTGLFHETRPSPDDPSKTLYGDDARYMLPGDMAYGPDDTRLGLWQTPTQLARFLIHASGRCIRLYLDIGTLSGWTVTVVVAYLRRFGLQRADTLDIFPYCHRATQELWARHGLPITYVRCEPHEIADRVDTWYDCVFIDGDHSYGSVRRDYETYKDRARMLVFHDINDAFCAGVVQLWTELKAETAGAAELFEFTAHPNGFRLMGIGCLEWRGEGTCRRLRRQ
jgi:Methyltransferase domain